jgi:hypothetical protein
LSQAEVAKCIHRITSILVKVREHIAETLRAWAKFNDQGGDIAYFSDISDRKADEAIDSIRDAFRDLLGFEQKLVSMRKNCKIWARTVI